VNIPYSDKVNINIIQFQTKAPVKGVVLYFHGNKKNIGRYGEYAADFTQHGYELWMIDYPGFGKSTGMFTEKKLYDDALIFYKLARARFSPDSIIVYGRSLGTGIATRLASVRDCRYLLLETPYYSVPSLFASYLPVYPMSRMIHYKFPTHQFLKDVTAPVVIFHGKKDWTTPYRNAARLKPLLKPKDQFILIEKGEHNNLREFPVYREKIDSIFSN
jgi:hypothetical protein